MPLSRNVSVMSNKSITDGTRMFKSMLDVDLLIIGNVNQKKKGRTTHIKNYSYLFVLLYMFCCIDGIPQHEQA